jgi:RNA polymerase sigma-70 factor, ECF subfamily
VDESQRRETFEKLLDGFEKKVFRMAVMMLRDAGRAEEVTQDIFLKIWQALPGYDGRASLSTWLYTIARNTCLSAVRSESYRRTELLDELSGPKSDPRTAVHIDLARGLASLPEAQREALTLFYLEDRSIADVAKILDIPEGTVKSLLHRARRTLGGMME